MSAVTDKTGQTAVRMDAPTLGGSTGLKNLVREVQVTLGDTTPPCTTALREFVGTVDPTGLHTEYNDEVAPVGSKYTRLYNFDATTGLPANSQLYLKKEKAVANTSSGFTLVTQA